MKCCLLHFLILIEGNFSSYLHFVANCSLSVVLQSGKFGKLNKTIKFPEFLNLAPYMSGTSDKSPVYQLYGVVVHLDVMNAAFSGHYVCYVRNFHNKWYKVDDSSVCPLQSLYL